MLFDAVGYDWHSFYEGLRKSVSVLVVDDEPVVSGLVRAIFASEGWAVEIAETAEDAWDRIQTKEYDLLVTDKNLPGKSGVELIAQVMESEIDLPSLVITGYASVESVVSALAAGASDYITKPFDDVDHVRKRASSIVERRLQGRLYSRIVSDLAAVVTRGEKGGDMVRVIGRELFVFKRDLAARPDLLLVADEETATGSLAETLLRAGHTVRLESTPEAALNALSGADAPIASVVSLQMRFPVTLVADLRHRDPLLGVLVTSSAPRLSDALAAVEAGASDFFLQAVESPEALEVRARRLVENSHRSRLYLQLISILHRAATEQGHQVATALWQLLPESHRDYLTDATQPPPTDLPSIDVPIAEIFDDDAVATNETAEDRRTHARISARQVEVWFRAAGSDEAFSRGGLLDLSVGGFFLRTKPPLLRGTEIEAHLLVHGDPPSAAVGVVGRVVRIEAHDPDPEKLSGNGILIEESSQSALAGVVDRVGPQPS